MGLPAERVARGKGRSPVAEYIRREDWLQSYRVELNAMTTPEFIEWLDGKMEEHAQGKLIPPDQVLEEQLRVALEAEGKEVLEEQILREGELEERAATALRSMEPDLASMNGDLRGIVERGLAGCPVDRWTEPVLALAEQIAEKAGGV